MSLPVSQTLPSSDQSNHMERTAGSNYSLTHVGELVKAAVTLRYMHMMLPHFILSLATLSYQRLFDSVGAGVQTLLQDIM